MSGYIPLQLYLVTSNALRAQRFVVVRDTLLPRLISGQLRLRQADALAA
jgi:hypothetical protein